MNGDFGESLANILLGQEVGGVQLFETVMIGGKWPTIDIYAEINSPLNQRMFCFFQVKSTVQGFTTRGHRLKIQATREKINKLANFDAPTYLIGIHYNAINPPLSVGYIKTIRGAYATGISSMETTWQINSANLTILRDEVEAFWTALNPLGHKAIYHTNF